MKTFLMVPGFERCGTSWLHDYLSNNNKINFGTVKEYNFFNSIYLDEYKIFKEINKLKPTLKSFYDDEYAYYNYFLNILNSCNLTGDFSPGYTSLNYDIFYKIKNIFFDNNIKVKVILLLRDPVQRHVSATKMRIQYSHLNITNNEYNKILINNINDPIFKINSNYNNSYNKLLNIFKDDFLTIKYENLFTNESINNICNFLEIEYAKPDFLKFVNHTKDTKLLINDNTIDILNQHYKEQTLFLNNL